MAHLDKNKQTKLEAVTYEFPYMQRPAQISKWESFALFLYNPKTNAVLGRTAKNWGQLLVFYCIFYIVLAALFSICMYGLLRSLNNESPTWQLDTSLIGSNPGLVFRPMPDDKAGTLITYDSKDINSAMVWTSQINSFLEPYQENIKPGMIQNQQTCDFSTPPRPGNICAVDPTVFGPCNANDGFGYNKSSPCVFLKLNKIYGWAPDMYNDVKRLPTDMPEDLIHHIASRSEEERYQIWVSCKPEHTVGGETANATIDYFPTRGFPGFYYPYTNLPGYLNPIIAVQFKNLPRNTLLVFECRTWAKNIIYRGGILDRRGSVRFEILID